METAVSSFVATSPSVIPATKEATHRSLEKATLGRNQQVEFKLHTAWQVTGMVLASDMYITRGITTGGIYVLAKNHLKMTVLSYITL